MAQINNMDSGLTIAFISCKNTHTTVQNFKQFGDKYWDDTLDNKSKIGYYFAYYFQKKYVYIHKIINLLQPDQRPVEMINWDCGRQILCLSERLMEFTWNEWITGIGFGSPYIAADTRQCKTSSWSFKTLKTHPKFHIFDIINFKNIIENNSVKNRRFFRN